MKVNMFKPSQNGFNTLLNHLGQTVKVNNQPTKAVITNVQLNENYDERYLNTKIETKRGQHIAYENLDWYIVSQVSTKRYDNYKAVIKQADHYVRFNLSTYDRNTSTYTEFEIYELPVLMNNVKGFGMEGNQIILNTGEIQITLSDNEITRKIYDVFLTQNSPQKHNLFIDGRQYTYEGFEFDKKGLIKITLSTTSTGTNSYGINWNTEDLTNWDFIINKGYYGDKLDVRTNEPPYEPEPEPPSPSDTNVGAITAVVKNQTDVDYGSVTFSFTGDANAVSYRVKLFKDNTLQEELSEQTALTYLFDNLVAGDYYITVESKLEDETYLNPQQSDTYTIILEVLEQNPDDSWVSPLYASVSQHETSSDYGKIKVVFTKDSRASKHHIKLYQVESSGDVQVGSFMNFENVVPEYTFEKPTSTIEAGTYYATVESVVGDVVKNPIRTEDVVVDLIDDGGGWGGW